MTRIRDASDTSAEPESSKEKASKQRSASRSYAESETKPESPTLGERFLGSAIGSESAKQQGAKERYNKNFMTNVGKGLVKQQQEEMGRAARELGGPRTPPYK